jgi:hypothetical protein
MKLPLPRRTWLRLTALAGYLLLSGVLVLLLGLSLMRPSGDRDWKSEHAVLPLAEFTGDQVTITGVRDFREHPDGSVTEARYDRTYDLSQLESLWYVLAVFHEDDWRGPAHSMFSFGFSEGSFVVISVEARKEVGEDYSIWQGLRRKYEVIYVVGDERDLVRTRAVFRTDNVYLYPVKATPEKIRQLFTGMLDKANDLRTHPEFYNTVTNNCTTKLRDHVNEIAPGLIPNSWRVQLPGFSDELVSNLGLLDDSSSLTEARHRYWINERARQFADDPDFSRRIRSLVKNPD